MHKIFIVILLCFINLGFISQAQESHKVERDETLFSVSKKYGIPISDIIKANPDANRGLREGMRIIIPTIHTSVDTVVYIMHKVRPLESFYSIKNKFGTEESLLLEFNPQLIEGFRAGTYIKIPQFDELDVTAEIIEVDALVKRDDIHTSKANTKFIKKAHYNIAFLLPLYLDKNDTLETFESFNEGGHIYKKSHYALDFYAGAKIAIDSLNASGVSMNIHVFDTKNDPNVTFDLVADNVFDSIDVVFGPFYSKNFRLAAGILSRKGIPVVAPLSTKANLLEDITNAFQIIPSQKRQLNVLSSYISSNYIDKNITLVRKNTDQESRQAEWMTESFDFDSIINYKEIIVNQAVIDSIHHELDSLAETNVILIPSGEKDFVIDLLTKLNATRDSNFVVFGLSSWSSFKSLDYTYLENLNVHIPNSGLLSYEKPLSKYFVSKYHEEVNSDPSPRFAFAGFDISFYFLSLLYEHGGLSTDMYMEPNELLNNNFDFNYKRNTNNGSRNQAVQIVKYENYRVKKVE
jgi:peptidoglycan endopeptidase LytF